ncbi:MAG: Rab family GTPase [Candidatus Odinarchaeia archaeon]
MDTASEKIINLKVLLLGDPAVGKTSLITRFVKGKFKREYKITIGVDIMSKTIALEDKIVNLSIWDIAGQDRFKAFRNIFYNGASGALIVFDITRKSTFDNLKSWLDELKQFCKSEVALVLIGNKADLSELREVEGKNAVSLAEKLNAPYIETSAKTGDEVDNAFKTLTIRILNKLGY